MRIFSARRPVQTATRPIVQPRDAFDELSHASALLSEGSDFSRIQSILVEQACDISQSDIAALYLYSGDSDAPETALRLSYRRGPYQVPPGLDRSSETIRFIEECGEAAVLNARRDCALAGLLLDPAMQAGIVIPIFLPQYRAGLLVLNARETRHYGRDRLNFLVSYCALAAGMLRSAGLFKELKERAAEIEALERYQESVFSSMTNLLVTTSRDGSLRFFNDEAADAFGLDTASIGKPTSVLLSDCLDASVVSAIDKSLQEGSTLLGVEGIANGKRGDIDFSLNLSPVRGRRSDRHDGLVLTFTDQTRERELKERVDVVVEERRAIKDMFSRYLSANVVQSLMDSPDSIKLGGDGKRATVFFADIRGYTTFSEGKTPEYVLGVLNDYFSEAVEVVLQYRGFIDKFIGDCIMAAWGVPLTSEEEDARNAVACALDIQKLIENPKRSFFRGEAEHLRVGIGVNTGYLIAGNLGSYRHMNYSVIGDTVNIAARLEGVAKAGEVIITESTRALLGDTFDVEQRDTVKVKGKAEPLRIYRALAQKIQ